MRFRIIESNDGTYYPQCKPGFFRRWNFLENDADTSLFMREIFMLTKDPADAARFNSPSAAQEFIDRVRSKTDTFWNEVLAAEDRISKGVSVRRVIK